MIIQFLWSSVYFWVPAIIFLALADEVREKEPLPGDVSILTGINSFASPLLDNIFLAITALGSAFTVIVAVTAAAAAMYYLGKRRGALFLLFAAGGTALINSLFKLFFARERPELWEQLVTEPGYSFPSGHAMISSALALSVILLTWHTKYRWYAVVFGILYTLSVSISRVYLGVHFPSDIVAGWCVSVLWVLTLHHVFARFANRKLSN